MMIVIGDRDELTTDEDVTSAVHAPLEGICEKRRLLYKELI